MLSKSCTYQKPSKSYSSTLSHPRCRKLPKALKEWQAFLELKKKIDDFNECCPLLEMMASKAMMSRHWDRIAVVTKHTFDVESDAFLLRNIMMAPLLENKEDIEVSMFTSGANFIELLSSEFC